MKWITKKVLVVEDSPIINKLLVHSLSSQLQIGVDSASTLESAQKIIKNNEDEYLVAILDLNLPDAPNGEVVDCILKAGIPPIILTGNMSDNLHAEMLEKPIVDYVIKRNLNEIDYVVRTVERLRDNHERKVLIVDDSMTSRKLMSALLKRHNFLVLEAKDGEEALLLLNKFKDISLMISDYNMPGINGMELTTKVREKYSRTELAIIGLSATGNEATTIRFLKAGANDFIARPFIHEEFYCRINQNIDAIASYKALQESANKDFLTGLNNRSYLYKTGELLLQNAARNNISLSTVMIDIDHFKVINDNHGHQIGDQVLKHIAVIFKDQMRESDVLARVGGEEFCLLCVNLDESQAPKLFERFLNAVQNNPLTIEDLTVCITISIGYSLIYHETLDEMINEADQALYLAKKSGRNQAKMFKPDQYRQSA